MTNRLFSLFFGLFYVAFGIIGFVPGLRWMQFSTTVWRNTDVTPDTALLFGCLPVTTPLNLLHVLIGAVGVFVAASFTASLRYAQALAIVMTLLVINGALPFGLNSYWGLLPLSGGQLAIHLISAPIAFYFGYVYGAAEPATPELA